MEEDNIMSLEIEEEARTTNSSGADLEEWIHNNTLNMDDFNETIYEGNKESLTQVTNTSDLIQEAEEILQCAASTRAETSSAVACTRTHIDEL